jgi:cyanobactin maturation PatA/PatG family protease
MCDVSKIPGLAELWERTLGDQRICVAVVDGPVDTRHEAFAGADVAPAPAIWSQDEGFDGAKARHGTHVASVIFGQHGGPVRGVAPACRGVSVAAFSDRRRTSQLDLARGIELAAESGAHVISVSGGELTQSGEAEDFLARAVQKCQQSNILVVAAAGNDGCFCDDVPAALPSVLAVGALDDAGEPLPSSNWGPAYQEQGILAPGEKILGAVPGGTVTEATGTSLATPIVAGVAALLLSLQAQAGLEPDPLGVRAALLESADPCELEDPQACQRFLSGKLNIRRAMSAVTSDLTPAEGTPAAGVPEHACTCGGAAPVAARDIPVGLPTADALAASAAAAGAGDPLVAASASPAGAVGQTPPPPGGPYAPVAERPLTGVTLSQDPSPQQWAPYVYVLGILGYDFGTEARRDSFKQLMAPVAVDETVLPANPYDARQMVDHLVANPSEAKPLIWTLNLELTPVYAVEPVGPYAASVYELLTRLLAGEVSGEDDTKFIERVSIPGRLTDRHMKLFSGQTVPVVEVEQIRGLYGWQINTLIRAATDAAQQLGGAPGEADISGSLREFLTRIYYDLRNLGNSSRDRALNFAATNAFQAAHTFAAAVAGGMALDTIDVEKSPFCRMDSDCWDVKLRFFDPENSRRARKVFRFTIDVSDILPVSLGDVRSWSEAG